MIISFTKAMLFNFICYVLHFQAFVLFSKSFRVLLRGCEKPPF